MAAEVLEVGDLAEVGKALGLEVAAEVGELEGDCLGLLVVRVL